jgi:hypothetical protein
VLERAAEGLRKLTPSDGERIVRLIVRRCRLNLIELHPGQVVVHRWSQQQSSLVASVVSRCKAKVIPAFYPIPFLGEEGDRDMPRQVRRGGHGSKQVRGAHERLANPALGDRTKEAVSCGTIRVEVPLGSFNQAGVGSFRSETNGTELVTELGVGPKKSTANSSTMKGAKALAGEWQRRRCRTAMVSCRRVGEALLPSAPRNHTTTCANFAGAGARANGKRLPGNTG